MQTLQALLYANYTDFMQTLSNILPSPQGQENVHCKGVQSTIVGDRYLVEITILHYLKIFNVSVIHQRSEFELPKRRNVKQ